MTALAALLSAVEPIEDGFRTAIPADWLQGRTAYFPWIIQNTGRCGEP